MHLKFRNVNDAFEGLVRGIHQGRIPTDVQSSRNGEVLQVSEPMIVTYERPTERVLFNSVRDCNPFFHLFESLWMLAGCNDVAALKIFNSRIGDYSDDGLTFNGAYGYRWRYAAVMDDDAENGWRYVNQLSTIINHLKANPTSRRAVLQMWNVKDDLLKIGVVHPGVACYECSGSGITPGTESTYCKHCSGTGVKKKSWTDVVSKDVCCNISVMFSVESGDCRTCEATPGRSHASTKDYPGDCPACKGSPHDQPRYLNMTVTNRSNDLIWGMLGANVVHFSMLQEYVADSLGLEVGSYHQFTNNLHVYTETNSGWKPKEWLSEYGQTMHDDQEVYDQKLIRTPLVLDQGRFDREVLAFVHAVKSGQLNASTKYAEPFLETVAKPMCLAFAAHKQRLYPTALALIGQVRATDWMIAGHRWLLRREVAYLEKQNG